VKTPTFRWSAAAPGACGALTYELEVDDTCPYQTFTSCTFPSPEVSVQGLAGTDYTPATELPVSVVAPVGTRYFWRVRACDSAAQCSAWSSIFYVDVGRLLEDINGDGYGDIVANGSVSPGALRPSWVFMGGNPLDPMLDATYPTDGRGFDRYPQRFLGDTNGDGFNDVGIHQGVYTDEHRMKVIFGGPALSSLSSIVLMGATPIAGTPGIYRAGDFDADGLADFFLTDSRDTSDSRAELFVGSTSLGATSLPAASVQLSAEPGGAWFAQAAEAVGDLDGDGFSDVLFLSGGESKVYALRGHSPLGALELTAIDLGVTCLNGALARAGDVTLDGLDDAVIGCPEAANPNPGAQPGAVAVLYGAPTFPLAAQSLQRMTSASFGAHSVRALGSDVVGGSDLTGDGIADLVIGTGYPLPMESSTALLIPGANGGVGALEEHVFGSTRSDRLSLGDHDGDGLADLVTLTGWYAWGSSSAVTLNTGLSVLFNNDLAR